jgi:hypothetical protein
MRTLSEMIKNVESFKQDNFKTYPMLSDVGSILQAMVDILGVEVNVQLTPSSNMAFVPKNTPGNNVGLD